jgi:nicotinamide-nucleotide amidase
MVETYREAPLNMEVVCKILVEGIKKYLHDNHIEHVVIGLSGGIDSTVVAALCRMSNAHVIGVSLPCSTNADAENDSALAAGKEFCDSFKVVNLQEPYEVMEKFCTNASGIEKTPISQGNIKARLRMITLYDIASKVGGIVMDTDNLTEHFLGFWTLHGDDADFNPIGGLWKHEVYDLAKYMKENIFKDSKALEQAIALMPTDGNGVKDGGDLAQIAPGKTYDDVDEILYAWVGLDSRIKDIVIKNYFDYGVFKKLCEKHGYETVEAVILRSVRSEFKRKQRPFIIDVYRGLICEKDGKILAS